MAVRFSKLVHGGTRLDARPQVTTVGSAILNARLDLDHRPQIDT